MKNQPFISFLKLFREDAVFDSAGRLFHILAPRKEKHFCPLADLFFGNLKSVSVFWRLREEHAEFFVKRLHKQKTFWPSILLHFHPTFSGLVWPLGTSPGTFSMEEPLFVVDCCTFYICCWQQKYNYNYKACFICCYVFVSVINVQISELLEMEQNILKTSL